MRIDTVVTAVTEIQQVGTSILEIVKKEDPAVELPVDATESIIALAGDMAVKALSAWSAASGVPITVDSVKALLPNSAPLDLPDDPAPAATADVAGAGGTQGQAGTGATPAAASDRPAGEAAGALDG